MALRTIPTRPEDAPAREEALLTETRRVHGSKDVSPIVVSAMDTIVAAIVDLGERVRKLEEAE